MKRIKRQWLGFVLVFIGYIFLVSPFVVGFFGELGQKKSLQDYYDNMEARKENQQAENDSKDASDTAQMDDASDTAEKEEEYKNDPFYIACVRYNDAIRNGGQDAMHDLADLESHELDAAEFGYEEDVIGTINIPRLEIELSIYLGASRDHMAKGVAAFGMTSVPLGEESENCSIAGHRGWRGTPVFRNIQAIQPGDPIYVITPWKKMVYRACEFKIVTPNDTSWCHVQDGRSLISLMTCHPYGNNYQRYIVFAELTDEEIPSEEEIKKQNEDSYSPSDKQVLQVNADGTSEYVTVSSESIKPDGKEYGSFYSNVVILAEDRMKIISYIMTGVVLLVFIYLLIQTQKKRMNPDSEHKRDREVSES